MRQEGIDHVNASRQRGKKSRKVGKEKRKMICPVFKRIENGFKLIR